VKSSLGIPEMYRLLSGFIAVALLAPAPATATEWFKITENAAKDQFFVDRASIIRQGDRLSYWEYREFQQPNDAFLAEALKQPVYGLVMSWLVNCTNRTQQLRQVTAYAKDRTVIQKLTYDEKTSAVQPRPGSSASRVLEYVCKSQPIPQTALRSI
jgi:hypothetical protein